MVCACDLLTKEYPPEVYGGAGVHVEYLARELRKLVDVRVHCMGGPGTRRASRRTRRPPTWSAANPALRTLGTDLAMAAGCAGSDVVHSHTWYANLAGPRGEDAARRAARGTAHSLEPLRPWKAEQLGGGYALSSWVRADGDGGRGCGHRRVGRHARRPAPLLSGGRPRPGACRAQRHRHRGVRTRPRHRRARRSTASTPTGRRVVFVGRITRQKGLPHLLRAALSLDPAVQLVLCAGAPDTEEILAEVIAARRRAARRPRRRRVDPADAAQARRHPDPEPCNGVRLPLGLRADGHRQPRGDGLRGAGRGDGHRRHPRGRRRRRDRAARADRAGRRRHGTPRDAARFEADLAERISELVADPKRARTMGEAGGAGPSSCSPGPPSPRAPSTSTARWSELT